MRTERNRDASWNVWMTRDEYAEIPRHAHCDLAEVAIRLMGDCGLHGGEVLDVIPVLIIHPGSLVFLIPTIVNGNSFYTSPNRLGPTGTTSPASRPDKNPADKEN